MKDDKNFFDEQGDYEILLRYNEFSLFKHLRKHIKLWVKHPRIFWLKSRVIQKPMYVIKDFLYCHPTLRRPYDYLFYVIKSKYVKVNCFKEEKCSMTDPENGRL